MAILNLVSRQLLFAGGEAQRIKLATELSKRSTGKTMYILDEPTTGLHSADVKRLLGILQQLVEGGNSMIIIEHNLDVIKSADWIIDMGPEGGIGGGTVVACGTPEDIAKVPNSFTGKYLKRCFKIIFLRLVFERRTDNLFFLTRREYLVVSKHE